MATIFFDLMVSFWHWHNEPLLIGSILVVGWLYALCIGPFHTIFTTTYYKTETKRKVCFYASILCFYIAVGSPIDSIGENFLFSVHMIQHNILMYVVPPLFVIGIPEWLIDSILSKNKILKKVFILTVNPVFSGFVFSFVFIFWHVPILYEAALHNKTIHIIEHVTMFIPSVWVWWKILAHSKYAPALPFGLQILFLSALMVAQTPLFGILTFASDVLYPTYAYAPRICDLSPIGDQRMGGFIMKIANMIVSLYILGSAFYKWSKEQTPELYSK